MKNLENYSVQRLNNQEIKILNGGSSWSWIGLWKLAYWTEGAGAFDVDKPIPLEMV